VRQLLLSSIAFSVGGAFMKPSNGFTQVGPSSVVIVCFVFGAVLLTRAVGRGNLSTTYVLGLGIEAVVSVAVGLAVLGERLTTRQAAGIGLIVLGLVAARGR
jgi:multidrug transporter EmrE-like cation transporter